MSWEAQNEKNILVMSVKDTGYGMNDEQLDVLFEDYSRFTPERDGIKIEGTGLGLAITKRLVMLMGADISVESKQGEGSCFTVRLPQGVIGDKILDKETIEMLQSRETHDDPEEKFNGTILIVDDLEINLYVAKAVMDSFGLNVDIALSGGEAIDKINNGNAYDIIFMDYMMPQMNGVETVKHLRDMGYDAPIVALTADTATEKAEMFIENGFDGTIVKPIDARQVNHILRRYIQN
jgi:CheY-like chemotaxis protein